MRRLRLPGARSVIKGRVAARKLPRTDGVTKRRSDRSGLPPAPVPQRSRHGSVFRLAAFLASVWLACVAWGAADTHPGPSEEEWVELDPGLVGPVTPEGGFGPLDLWSQPDTPPPPGVRYTGHDSYGDRHLEGRLAVVALPAATPLRQATSSCYYYPEQLGLPTSDRAVASPRVRVGWLEASAITPELAAKRRELKFIQQGALMPTGFETGSGLPSNDVGWPAMDWRGWPMAGRRVGVAPDHRPGGCQALGTPRAVRQVRIPGCR